MIVYKAKRSPCIIISISLIRENQYCMMSVAKLSSKHVPQWIEHWTEVKRIVLKFPQNVFCREIFCLKLDQ